MKNLGILCLTLLLLSTVSAIEFNLNPIYPHGGAIITTISGSFQDTLVKEDFSFYRNHVRVPMNFDLKKIEDTYYLYVNLVDKDPNNYSILIEEVKYIQGAKVITEDLQRNFTVNEEIADFSINKGFIMTEDDFSLTVQNLQDTKIQITSTFNKISNSKTLYSGEISEFKFNIEDAPLLSIETLEIKSNSTKYEVPVYILGIPEVKEKVNFNFDIDSLNITLDLNNETKRTVYLENIGEETIFQIKLSLDEELQKYVFISKEEIFNLSAGFLYPIELVFFSDDLPRKINGNLNARSGSVKDDVFINITFLPGYETVEEDLYVKSCSEMGGFECFDPVLCQGGVFIASDGNCCPTSCGLKGDSDSSFKIFGWLLIIILIIGGVWLYFKKYRGAEGPAKGVFKFINKKE